jgi:hypothetical protein
MTSIERGNETANAGDGRLAAQRLFRAKGDRIFLAQ